jgi:hypothetical protein
MKYELNFTDEQNTALTFVAAKDNKTVLEYLQFVMDSACQDYMNCMKDADYEEIKKKLEIAPEKIADVKNLLSGVIIVEEIMEAK